MRQNLKEQLLSKEVEIKDLNEKVAKLSAVNNIREESVTNLSRRVDDLRDEVEHYRRNKVIAEARMAGFIEATNLFIKEFIYKRRKG